MVKRTLIFALWFYVGWTLGGFFSYVAGVPELVGPVLGLVAALAVDLFPRLGLTRSGQGLGRSEPVA